MHFLPFMQEQEASSHVIGLKCYCVCINVGLNAIITSQASSMFKKVRKPASNQSPYMFAASMLLATSKQNVEFIALSASLLLIRLNADTHLLPALMSFLTSRMLLLKLMKKIFVLIPIVRVVKEDKMSIKLKRPFA